MFSRKDSKSAPRTGRSSPSGLSFIGPEVVISGDLTTTAQLHVDGRIDGHVRCGQLCQGESGIIAGDLTSGEARIAGLIEGTVSAATLIVEATGRIAGDVTYETISIAAGARIDGRLARRTALATEPAANDMLTAKAAASAPAKSKVASSADLFPAGRKAEALVVD